MDEHYAADDLVIFVGHSSDGRDYAEAVRELTGRIQQELNAINEFVGPSSSCRVIKIFLWETDALPIVGGQDKAINPHLARANIAVFVFRDRVGKITWQELNDCRKRTAPIPVIAVFPNAPPAMGMDNVDIVKAWLDLVEKRRELGSDWAAPDSKALLPTDPYRDREQLQQIVFENVQKVVRKLLSYTAKPLAEKIPALDRAIPPGYRQWLQEQCEEVGLVGLQDTQGMAVRLHHVYVPLTTTRDLSGEEGETRRERADHMPDKEQKPVLLLEQLASNSLYVAGAPGSGKSTFCKWVAWLACAGAMPKQPVAPPPDYGETFPDAFRNRLPLFVPLREFWHALPAANSSLSCGGLENALFHWIDDKRPGELTSACVLDQLQAGTLLLILDGFDEVPISHTRDNVEWHPKALLLSGLIDALKKWRRDNNRVLLTSRPHGIKDSDAKRLNLQPAPIAELDNSLRELLAHRWFHALAGKPERGAQLAKEMLAHIRGRQELSPLVGNPLLLTAMCVIYNQGKRLPRDKHNLYDRILDCVLHSRYADDQGLIDKVRKQLSVIAYGMHTGHGLDEDRQTPQAEATYDEVDRLIQRLHENSPAVEKDYMGAVQIREDLLNNSGILLPKGDKTAGYYHFTLQDFLAAQLLLDRYENLSELAELFRRRSATNEWRSTLSFVFSSLMKRNTLPDKGIRLLESLIDPLTFEQIRLAVVVADCLEVLSGHKVQLQAGHVEKFRQLCLDAIARKISLPERQQLALALGRLGDPRVIVDLRDHNNLLAWVMIPPNTFPIGDDPNHPDYKYFKPLEQQTFEVKSPFWITRFPVTNAQYELFKNEGGYENEACWSDAGRDWRNANNIREPAYWHDAKWNGKTQPVVGVSYWEADAFAKWCGATLPSERQWEAAARGPNGLVYPWGLEWENGFCNSWEAKLGVTSVVGLFPRSQLNAFKLDDMAGNVWEWCADAYDPKRTITDSGCVVRGGSWVNGARDCRAAIRSRDRPDDRSSNVGFRVLYSRQDLP